VRRWKCENVRMSLRRTRRFSRWLWTIFGGQGYCGRRQNHSSELKDALLVSVSKRDGNYNTTARGSGSGSCSTNLRVIGFVFFSYVAVCVSSSKAVMISRLPSSGTTAPRSSSSPTKPFSTTCIAATDVTSLVMEAMKPAVPMVMGVVLEKFW